MSLLPRNVANLPLPPSLSAFWQLHPSGSHVFLGSASEMKDHARVGDAILNSTVARVLAGMHSLQITPRCLTQRLTRNVVLAELASAYNLSRGPLPLSSFGTHKQGDLFEAFAASVGPSQVKGWVEGVFPTKVFEELEEEVRAFGGRLDNGKYRRRIS
ncbi:hypothetical protein JCM8547_007270 [Rhodosporidiobolus lusitaniae]